MKFYHSRNKRDFSRKGNTLILFSILLITIYSPTAKAQFEDTLVSEVRMPDGTTKTLIVVNEYTQKLRRGTFTITASGNTFKKVSALVNNPDYMQDASLRYLDGIGADLQISYRFPGSKLGLMTYGYLAHEDDYDEFLSLEYGGGITYALSTWRAVAKRNILRRRNPDTVQVLIKHPVVLYNIAYLQVGYLRYQPGGSVGFHYDSGGPTPTYGRAQEWKAHHIYAGINFQRICNVSAHHTSAHPKRLAGATWTKFGKAGNRLDLYLNLLLSFGGKGIMDPGPGIEAPKFGAGYKLGVNFSASSRKSVQFLMGIETGLVPFSGTYIQYFGLRLVSMDIIL
jgi:hypothetical protein